jgi:Uncharacterised nucleotidyltransferase
VKSEDLILFACARQDFQPRHRERVEELVRSLARPVDWEGLAETAGRHGVLPIVGANLRRCDPAVLRLPAPLAERLEVAAFENALIKEQDSAHLAEALARLREVGLEAMLLKGAALDLLIYAEPWVASSRDTDLLVRPLPGFRPGPEERALRRDLYRHGIECDLGEHHDVNMNGVLPVSFARIWRDARPVRFRGQDAWLMAPEDLLLSLCINSCRKRFLRLKGLFDIAESIRRLEGLDWERLARKACDDRCEGIVFAALSTADATVGCELPDGALAALGLGAVRAALLRGLVAGALRTSSLCSRSAAGPESRPGLPLLLSYASYRWDQAWRSFRFALTHPEAHLPPGGRAAWG